MKEVQIACPVCGTVSTLDDWRIGMDMECSCCGEKYKLSQANICSQQSGAEARSAVVVKTENVNFTCPTCGYKQKAAVDLNEKKARCSICSSMVDVSRYMLKSCPHCHNKINSEDLICPVCKGNTRQAPAVKVSAAVQPLAAAGNYAAAPAASRKISKIWLFSVLTMLILFGGGIGAFVYFAKDNDSKNIKKDDGKKPGNGSSSSTDALPDKIKKVSPSVMAIVVKTKKGEGVGTGFAVSDKYIITNRHVVEGTISDQVTIGNPVWKQRVMTATIREVSQAYDLAWLEIDNKDFKLAPMALSTGLLAQGVKVYTLGYPGYSFGQSNSIPQLTVADGIIKSNNRVMDRNPCYESSATINGGNSGGPLVNEKFEVVGVNTFKMKAEYAEGCFYSIKVDTIKLAFPDLWSEIKGE